MAAWMRRQMRAHMRKKGVKFRRTPHPPKICVIPARMMVMAAVMGTSWRVYVEARRVPKQPNWGEVAREAFRSKCDPSETEKQPNAQNAQSNGQKFRQKRDKQHDQPIYCEKCDQDVDLGIPYSPNQDYDVSCYMATTPHSDPFGNVGLLAVEDASTAVVDTGASITITPNREDFLGYEEEKGTVLKGIVKGSSIAGRGTVLWETEVDGKKLELHLKAVHVPQAGTRLLCPQQLIRQHDDLMQKNAEIADEGVYIHFVHGTLLCPYGDDNLPRLVLKNRGYTEENLKALNSCVLDEFNQNLSSAQKELMKWHNRLGHLGLGKVQSIMRSGALGKFPSLRSLRTAQGQSVHPVHTARREDCPAM